MIYDDFPFPSHLMEASMNDPSSHFFWRFSVKSTIQLCTPYDYAKPLVLSQQRFQNPPQALLQGRTTWAGGTGRQQLRRRPGFDATPMVSIGTSNL